MKRETAVGVAVADIAGVSFIGGAEYLGDYLYNDDTKLAIGVIPEAGVAVSLETDGRSGTTKVNLTNIDDVDWGTPKFEAGFLDARTDTG